MKSVGFAVTRSLGDVKAHCWGFINEPNIVMKLKESDELNVVCSDVTTDALES